MVRNLLIRGMLVGILAGLLAFAFGKFAGEPQVDRAISFESALDEAKAKADKAKGMHVEEEPELVSRPVQAGCPRRKASAAAASASNDPTGLVTLSALPRSVPGPS